MATSNTFGTITIVDVTDVGQYSVVPISDKGLLMIHDPNLLTDQYTPSSMTLTPLAYYANSDVTATSSYEWFKRTGNSSFNPASPGSAISTASSVTVSSSDFSSTKNITYYVKATHAPNQVGTLTAYGQISLSLVEQASNIQDIEITGDHLFKYKYTTYGGNPIIDGNDTVTLTADYTRNIAVYKWYYYTAGGAWAELTSTIAKGTSDNKGSVSGKTCTIHHTADIFSNNKARIKVTACREDAMSTELSDVYDEYTILKLYDGTVGAPGDSSIVIRLSNEDQVIPCDGSGVPTEHAFDLAYTDIQILDGGEDITYNNGWSITCTASGVTGSYSSATSSTLARYSAGAWASDNDSEIGYVTITATKDNYSPLTKTMSLAKIQTGKDGESPTVYNLSISPNYVTTDANGNTTSNIELTASVVATKEAQSTDVTRSTTDVIYYQWFVNGSSSASKSGVATGDDTNHTYSITSGTGVSSITCVIRKTDQSGVRLDSQSVAFVPKGAKGATGVTGDGAITLDFPQNTDTIGLDSQGNLVTDYVIRMPYTVYQGSTSLTATAGSGAGYSFSINGKQPIITWNSNHDVVATYSAGTNLYDATASSTQSLNGQCVIPITYTDAISTNASGSTALTSGTLLGTFTWNLSIAPENGSSITIDSNNTWTRYRQTSSAAQPSNININDATSIDGAISSAVAKPYYVWCRNHIAYLPAGSGSADTYSVNYYPADPENGQNGKSVQTSSTVTYAWSLSGTTVPTGDDIWKTDIATAVSGKTKPYYVWTKNETSYKYSDNSSAGEPTTTYSTSYYPEDKIELYLKPTAVVFQGNTTTITITPVVTKNASSYTIAGNDTLEWSYLVNGTMTPVNTTSTSANIYKSGNNLIVKDAAVNGATTIQCKFVAADGQTIYKYQSLEDWGDEFRCELYSTLGDKITNSRGSGFVYALLYRNGEEIHKLTNTPTVTTARTSTAAAVISFNTETLPSDIQDIDYQWSYQQVNSNGILEDMTPPDSSYNSSGKVIYLDGSMINKKIMISCTVTITYVT